MQISTRIVAAFAAAALSFGAFAAPTSAAKPAPTEPCAKEQVKVDKAEDALARVTAVFAKSETKVKKAKKVVAKAEGAKKVKKVKVKKAKKALAVAKKDRVKVKKAKKAQLQRLAKATERLTKCLAKEAPATDS